jgi:hypothetical protein
VLNSADVNLSGNGVCPGELFVSVVLAVAGGVGGRKRPELLPVRSVPDKEPVVPFGRKSELIFVSVDLLMNQE